MLARNILLESLEIKILMNIISHVYNSNFFKRILKVDKLVNEPIDSRSKFHTDIIQLLKKCMKESCLGKCLDHKNKCLGKCLDMTMQIVTRLSISEKLIKSNINQLVEYYILYIRIRSNFKRRYSKNFKFSSCNQPPYKENGTLQRL